jgi:hypothetical protein
MCSLQHFESAWSYSPLFNLNHWRYVGRCQTVGQIPQCRIQVGVEIMQLAVCRNRGTGTESNMLSHSECRATVYWDRRADGTRSEKAAVGVVWTVHLHAEKVTQQWMWNALLSAWTMHLQQASETRAENRHAKCQGLCERMRSVPSLDNRLWSIGGMIIGRGNWSVWRKPFPSATLSTTSSACITRPLLWEGGSSPLEPLVQITGSWLEMLIFQWLISRRKLTVQSHMFISLVHYFRIFMFIVDMLACSSGPGGYLNIARIKSARQAQISLWHICHSQIIVLSDKQGACLIHVPSWLSHCSNLTRLSGVHLQSKITSTDLLHVSGYYKLCLVWHVIFVGNRN